VVSLLAWGLGYFGQPHILVRFMSAKSIHSMPTARRINIFWMSCCLAGAIAVGFFGSVYFAEHPALATVVNTNSETVFIEIAKHLFTPWFTGILLAAILAAIMSNLSCQLLVCSSALTKDIYKTFLRKDTSQRELLFIGRCMVLVIAGVAMWIASDPHAQILKMVSYAWAGFGAAFGPVILISLIWSRMTQQGAIAGIVTGTLTVIIWKHYAWFNLYEIVPGFIFATISIVTVSLLNHAPTAEIKKIFNQVYQEVYQAS
jgi:sodium/proline symporter